MKKGQTEEIKAWFISEGFAKVGLVKQPLFEEDLLEFRR